MRNRNANDNAALFNNGTLRIFTSGGIPLATFTLGATAFGDSVAGVVQATGTPIATTGLDDGEANYAELRSSDETLIIEGMTVGLLASAAQVRLNTLDIETGQDLNLILLRITTSGVYN